MRLYIVSCSVEISFIKYRIESQLTCVRELTTPVGSPSLNIFFNKEKSYEMVRVLKMSLLLLFKNKYPKNKISASKPKIVP